MLGPMTFGSSITDTRGLNTYSCLSCFKPPGWDKKFIFLRQTLAGGLESLDVSLGPKNLIV